jgi:hypothetical protein
MAPPINTRGWTLDTLEKYFSSKCAAFDQQMTDMEVRNLERALSAEKAVTKAESAMDKRMESVNEFRKTLSDQAAEFMRRSEYLGMHQSLRDIVETNAARLTKLEAVGEGRREGLSLAGQFLLGVVAIIGVAVSVVLAGFQIHFH